MASEENTYVGGPLDGQTVPPRMRKMEEIEHRARAPLGSYSPVSIPPSIQSHSHIYRKRVKSEPADNARRNPMFRFYNVWAYEGVANYEN